MPVPTPITVSTADGDVPALDHGGTGPLVVLLHDRLENAARWDEVGRRLARFCHPVALDGPGHGHSRVGPLEAPVRWRMLAETLAHLDEHAPGRLPLVVGQGIGGWDATSAVVHDGLEVAGLVLLEAVIPGSPADQVHYLRQFEDEQLAEAVAERFQLGRRAADDAERDAAVDDMLRDAVGDWMLRGTDAEVLRAELLRSFVPDGAGWIRQPRPEIAHVMFAVPPGIDPPGHDYGALTVPLDIVAASDGMGTDDPEGLRRLVAGRTDRRLDVLPATRDIAGTHPQVVVEIVRRRLEVLGLLPRVERGGQRGR